MSLVYVDTSVLGRLLLDEPDAPAVQEELEHHDRHVASRLARVELRRLAFRHGLLEKASELLSTVALIPLDQAILNEAETLPPSSVATLDAIHLTTALRLAADGLLDVVMTYDARLAEGVRHHGLSVIAPTS